MNRIVSFITAHKRYFNIFLNLIVFISGLIGLVLFVDELGFINTYANIQEVSENQITQIHPNDEDLFIDIQGEVVSPGVYKFKVGEKILDAINYAGGLKESADSNYIANCFNLAEKLKDQQKIIIPAKNANKTCGSNISNQNSTKKISLNNSSLTELDSLPGIGPSTAQKIIDARPYSHINDLKEVSGIGESTFNNIKDLIDL